ncbi:MAG: DUF2202 domain-containing protein, partial [Spirochaetales bacterium]|nr:DUF2202 domain-containing protein [Spirochaetales bacterium]
PIFRNIAESEQSHMDATAFIIRRYGLVDPIKNDVPGVFLNPDLQELYDTLTITGEKSLLAALTVGAEIEDLDIYDLGRQLEISDNADLRIVYLNLEKGSRNHLRSFYGQITRQGNSYLARHIDAAYFKRIIDSDGERSGVITDPYYRF